MNPAPQLRYAVLPVADIDRAVRFYRALGCAVNGRDGQRWAGLASDHVALSLCGPDDPRRLEVPALAVRVDDAGAAARTLAAAGAHRVEPLADGAVRLTDPDGNVVLLTPR